jgi:hypothetical protein
METEVMCRDDVGIAMAMARVKLGIAQATPEEEVCSVLVSLRPRGGTLKD